MTNADEKKPRRRPPTANRAKGRIGGGNSLDDAAEHTSPVSPLAGAPWNPTATVEGDDTFDDAPLVPLQEPELESEPLEQVLTGQVVKPDQQRGFLDEPEFELAPADADPQVQFAHYQGIISNARRKVERVLDKTERYFRLTAGPALIEIHREESYKAAGFSTWAAATEFFGLSVRRSYQLMDSVRAMEWLDGVTSEVPGERQLRAILPIGDKYGKEAAQKVWRLAEERGRTSGSALDQAAIDLNFKVALEATPAEQSKQVELAWRSFEPALQALNDLSTLRRIAAETPEKGREIKGKLQAALAALGDLLDEE
ncbi:hypothetical protein [Streptosporangium lutulentum]|uniref:Uncharacterized protein n=1 Tax=Streptosporangium lutulentum TaxID=1461250 RepID=A0ABT9QWC0_9ACTN|nr:hypothetical protein [Streptosporangium lutulentum]MDP9850239.1 hypothetical protein [Streptosporangium lutulentum]